MANSLVDFVVSLVRDPAAAAAYAADPAQALADAHLTDVTSVDVQNLLPVVAESLSTAAPVHSFDAFSVDPGIDAGIHTVSNVWSSGAATAAFDAFDDHVPTTSVIDTDHSVPAIVDHLDVPLDLPSTVDTPLEVPSVQLDDLGAEHLGLAEPVVGEQLGHVLDAPGGEVHPIDHLPDLDLFH
ncbi:MAG: Rv0340 family protein [Mycobacterium kyogaense]|uniref:Rv0340 family IniB-related protein n=1 Tax=Mycobacterium kyogaense TaxID=2212479 RepID=UPI002FF61CA0